MSKECPKCEHIGARYCGEAATGLRDELLEIDLYGCIECGLVFLDTTWTDELEEWWQKNNEVDE